VDFDGDGRTDLLTGSISGKVYLYRRKPNGMFAAPDILKAQVPGKSSSGEPLNFGSGSSAIMADWFGTGKLDLLIGTSEGGLFLCKNEGTRQAPRFSSKAERLKAGVAVIEAEGGAAGPCVADWDGDGKLDLIVGGGSGQVVWYRNVGTRQEPQLDRGLTLVTARSEEDRSRDFEHPTRSAGYAKACVADWNGDGRPDLVVGDYTVGKVGREYRSHGWVWVYLRSADGFAENAKH
jgi:hypothetical protein